MYKLKKEFFHQEVVVYTPDNKVIKLDNATQEQFAEVYKIKGNEKYISKGKKGEDKPKEKITEEVVEPKEKITEEVVEPKEELKIIYTGEDINNAITEGNYNTITTIVKDLELFNGQGRPSKVDAIELLKTFLEDHN